MDKYSDSYDYSMMAVELLASYKGDGAILDYWASLDPGAVWETQFRKAFGISVDEFYARFNEHAGAGFPKLEPDVDMCPSVAGDRAALAALYNATGGTDWREDANWLTDAPICKWHGIFTDADGRVTFLALPGNSLTGKIPSALGELTSLVRLELRGNNLSGEIPAELGGLGSLEWMSILDNRLNGEIPPELGNLANLAQLSLHNNRLTGEIPPALGRLSNLKWLVLSGNQLTGTIPSQLGNLSNLQWLSLSQNQLTGPIPTELGDLANLERLSLSQNELTGPIPTELGDLANLEVLSLFQNRLTGEIPTELSSLANLEVLYLSQNQLTGEIPLALGSLTNLRELSLWDNRLTGPIPIELGSLAKLGLLYLSGNQLTGCIPDGLRDVETNDFSILGLGFCPEPPDTVSITAGVGSLTVVWNAPGQTGVPAITAYDLRYIRNDADETVDSNWTVVEDVWTVGSGPLQYTLSPPLTCRVGNFTYFRSIVSVGARSDTAASNRSSELRKYATARSPS